MMGQQLSTHIVMLDVQTLSPSAAMIGEMEELCHDFELTCVLILHIRNRSLRTFQQHNHARLVLLFSACGLATL